MIALRLVLDTNILVSAALKPEGPQRTVLLLSTNRPATLFVSAAILEEYRKVLARPELKIRKGLQSQFLQFLKKRTRLVKPSRRLNVTPHEDDNRFLECADAARADYLITGNVKHFPKCWKTAKIITSREFLDLASPHLIR